jgi:choline dehydrogenase-like flavoprotein
MSACRESHFDVTSVLRRASVLGAGTMGCQIAAHLANAGLPVLLLDVSKEAADQGLARATRLKPNPFFVAGGAALIHTGSLDDLSGLAASDWIIEAIIENLEAKRDLMRRVDGRAHRRLLSRRIPREFRSPRSRKGDRRGSAVTGSGRTSSIPHATCGSSSSSLPRIPVRTSPLRSQIFSIAG